MRYAGVCVTCVKILSLNYCSQLLIIVTTSHVSKYSNSKSRSSDLIMIMIMFSFPCIKLVSPRSICVGPSWAAEGVTTVGATVSYCAMLQAIANSKMKGVSFLATHGKPNER